MYSLQKFYEDEGKANPLSGESDVSFSVKLDGAALSLLYIDGKFTRALTRGDGIEGTDITNKFTGSKLIPQELHYNGVLQVTGEIAAPSHVPNARNYAAGALNLKDPSEFATRAVEFFAYGMQPFHNDTFDKDMEMLKRLGFNTVKDAELDKVYPTDGIVFRVNSNRRFEELGYTSSFPRGAYARKVRSATVESEIVDVEWNTSKSGKITPVAILRPIYIGDKLVSRATLNNIGFIESLDIQIGSRVAVGLGGEVIPVIFHKIE
jgi:DNA ligase (NAD+)